MMRALIADIVRRRVTTLAPVLARMRACGNATALR
jgi:hypothetical protein